jgi:hypothetical protein
MAPSLLMMPALNLCFTLGVLLPIGVSKSMQRLLLADGQFPKNGSMSYERSSGETREKTLHEEAKTTFGQCIVRRLRNAAAMLAAGKSVGEVLQSLVSGGQGSNIQPVASPVLWDQVRRNETLKRL